MPRRNVSARFARAKWISPRLDPRLDYNFLLHFHFVSRRTKERTGREERKLEIESGVEIASGSIIRGAKEKGEGNVASLF